MPPRPRADASERPSSVPDAVTKLQALRAEHRTLLDHIAGDPGMAAQTRAALLEHLREEEDERISQVAELAAARPAPAAPLPAARPARAGFTVGSMRPEAAAPPRAASPKAPPRSSVGSLRDR